MSSLMPLAIALGVTLVVTLARLSGTVDSDVAWQLWIAGRIHAGANLYTDVIETNPPLWFWMAIPVERAAAIFHMGIESALVIAIGISVALALAATDRLTRFFEPVQRSLFLAYAALMLAVMPWMHVGQREQIVLIATLPYAALITARHRGDTVSPHLAFLVGTGAALGFALKHYFLAIPASLELWLIASAWRQWRPIRPETCALVCAGIVYAAAIVLLEPDFITRIVPLLRLAYGVFGAPSVRFLFGPFAVVGLATLAVVATQWRTLASGRAPLAAALAVAGAVFATVYFVQFKGWLYHSIPMIGCGSLALAALLAEARTTRLLRILAPAALAVPLALSVQEIANSDGPSADLANAVAGLQPGDSVGFLTTETAVPWSVTLQGGFRYASRYNGFWMMRAIIRDELSGTGDPRLKALGRQIVSETVADFTCIPPARIIVTRPRPGEATFDILPFFLRDARFGALLSHYRIRSRTSVETYELVTPFSAPTAGCRHGV